MTKDDQRRIQKRRQYLEQISQRKQKRQQYLERLSQKKQERSQYPGYWVWVINKDQNPNYQNMYRKLVSREKAFKMVRGTINNVTGTYEKNTSVNYEIKDIKI